MAGLLTYNCFGLLRVTRTNVVVNITAVTDGGKPINRSYSEDFADPITEIEPDENAGLVFGAFIEDKKKTRITVHEIGSIRAGIELADIPKVGTAIGKAVDLIKKSANI